MPQPKKKIRYILPPISGEVLDKLPNGVYVVDKDGIIEFFNHTMLKMAGVKSAKEVIGLNVLTLPTYKKYGLTKYFRQGLQGKSFRIEAIKYTSYTGGKTTIRHYNGIPIKDEKGKLQKLLCIVEDITERKKKEEELRARNEELKQLNKLMVGRELKMIELKKALRHAQDAIKELKK